MQTNQLLSTTAGRGLILVIAAAVFQFPFGAAAADLPKPPIAGQMVPQIGHSQWVREIVYAPSGNFIVTASKDSKVKVWTPDGRLIRTILVGSHEGFALSPDEKTFALTKWHGRIELWSLAGERIAKLPKLETLVMGPVAFSPAGDYLVACTSSNKEDHCQALALDGSRLAHIVNPTNAIKKGKAGVAGIGFAPDGSVIYLGVGRSVYAYARSGELLREMPVTDSFLKGFAVSPDGTLMATGDSDLKKYPPKLRLWTTDGKSIAERDGHPSWSLQFSADSQWLVSGGWSNNRLLILDRHGETVANFRVGSKESETPATVALSPDRRHIVTSGKDITPVSIHRWQPDGTLVNQFRQRNNNVTAMDMDPKTGLIITASLDNMLRYWSLDGRLLRQHSSGTDHTALLDIAPNGSVFLSGGTTVTLWGADADAIASFKIHKKGSRAAVFTPDMKYLLTGGIDGYANIISLSTGEMNRIEAHEGRDVTAIAAHPDGKHFATGSNFNRFRIWDIDGNQLADFRMPEGTKPPFETIHNLTFTADGSELVVNTKRRHEEFLFYDMNGQQTRKISLPTRNTYENGSMAVSPDGRWIAGSVNRQIAVWDLETLELKRVLTGHTGWIGEMNFTSNGERLVSADTDGVVRVWNVDSRQSYALISEGDEWAVFTDDGYFDASRYGGDLVAMTNGMNSYSVDQFAVYFNRPDVLLERIGLGSQARRDHFRGYAERRLANLAGTPAGNAAVPRVEIVDSRQDGKFMSLDVVSEILDGAPGFLQVYVNDVPLYDGKGRPVSAGRQTTHERVELGSGRNKIEVGVAGATGVASLRHPVFADYHEAAKGDLYFVGLGVSKYRKNELDLNYAAKDVEDMEAFLQNYTGDYNNIHSLALTDSEVTRKSLSRAETFLAAAGVDDTVILLATGHGGYDYAKTPTYYFLSHEANPKKLEKTAIAYGDLEGLLAGIKPRRKLMLLDTCQSGEFDAATLATISKAAEAKGLSVRARKELISKTIAEPRPWLYERDRYIYNSLSRRTGAVVFSSSMASESSLEFASLENGVFTRAVMETLGNPAADSDSNGRISISELETGVKTWVAEVTGNLQHPTIDRENIYQSIELPLASDSFARSAQAGGASDSSRP